IFMPLIKKGLTLIEARHLIDRGLKSNPTAQAIVRGTGVDLIDHDWTWYADQPKRTQYEELLSSINMLRNFVTSERLQLIFGRQRNVLNLRSIMDEGKLLLINLSSRKLHQDLARLVGTLLVNEFFLVSKTRPEGSRPFYLAIDEFENYVTQDIADILDQGHKFGLRLILAHHSLEQLKEQNERVYAAVMQNAKVKILYGGLTYDNAEILVKELFTYIGQGGLDPKAIKHIQKSPYLEPRESTRTVRSAGQSESRSSGTSQSESSASGSSSGYAMVSGETSIPVDSLFLSDEIVQYITSTSSQTGESSQQGSGSGSFESESSGHSYTDSIVPFIEQNLKWYESSIQFSSLDEQVYSLVARMKNLPQQVCMVKLPKQAVATVRSTYVVTHHRLEGETEQFAKRLNQRSPYHALPAAAREERLRITDSLTNPPAEEPDSEDERWQ
ncbi:MAG: type IV secretory system conjugative DNA transfer family protein, partial [Patescibacteria group bacterium]